MKALFSSLYLEQTLKQAIAQKGWNRINFYSDEWILSGDNECSDIKLSVQYVGNSDNNGLLQLYIDRAQWLKLMQFLKLLPEQPIVLEIRDNGIDDIKLTVYDVVATF